MTSAEIILDSINVETGDRITTMKVTLPRIVLAELSTHRIVFIDDTNDAMEVLGAYDADIPSVLTKNSASSRAVPVNKMIERVAANPFIPRFRKGKKGMGSGEDVDELDQAYAEKIWRLSLQGTLHTVKCLSEMGIEKGQVNRLLEPFSYIEVLLTATEWKNFLMLRDHSAAQVEIQEVARAIRVAMDNSNPQVLRPGEWHLPYISSPSAEKPSFLFHPKRSAARCARISYNSFNAEMPSSPEEDMILFEKLAGSNPRHLAPLEPPSQAQADRTRHGNFIGFKSLRKIMFEGEESGGDLQ